MKIVGDHLAATAELQRDKARFDLFARSAFNRYYYGAFLVVRRGLQDIDRSWERTAHAEVPKILEGAVLKKLKQAIGRGEKEGTLKPGTAASLRSKATCAAVTLAQMMNSARIVRTVADYEPDRQVGHQGRVAVLYECRITEAEQWPRKAELFIGQILRAYSELGLV